MRVLVIDDDHDNAELLGDVVAMQGHEAVLAFNGESAIAAALQHLPQVVLLDIGLPDMDGYTVAQRLRQEATLAQVVLVALTGYSGPEHELKAQQAGFNHHLVKPVSFDDLARILTS